MIYLHKILPLIMSPLFIALIAFVIAVLFRSRRAGMAGLCIILLFSSAFTASFLTRFVEKNDPPIAIETLAEADAIIVLSGMVSHSFIGGKSNYDFGDATDRLFAGIALAKADKAPKLIFTRGQMPWSTGKPEGEILAQKAIEFGIERARIFLSPYAQNTEQEAIGLSDILTASDSRIILVTSAFHMPRARSIFTNYGFEVISFPTDHQTFSKKITFQDFLPQAGALNKSSFAIREMMGRAYYAIKLAVQ